jgi:hypothetical protein
MSSIFLKKVRNFAGWTNWKAAFLKYLILSEYYFNNVVLSDRYFIYVQIPRKYNQLCIQMMPERIEKAYRSFYKISAI